MGAPAPNSRDAMRARVDSNLNSHLASLSVCVGTDLEPDFTLQWVETQLPNFVALGALSSDEASEWKARFARAEQAVRAPDSDIVDEGTRARATEMLDQAVKSIGDKNDERKKALERFHASLYAFKALGVVSEADVSSWHDRVRQAIVEKRPEPKPEPRPYVAAALRRIVKGPDQRLLGVRLTCAQLYADCVMACWHRLVDPRELAEVDESDADPKSRDEVVPRWGAVLELGDDVGTQYAASDSAHEITGSRESLDPEQPIPVWGHSIFVPAVPEWAGTLTASWGGHEFRLSLRTE